MLKAGVPLMEVVEALRMMAPPLSRERERFLHGEHHTFDVGVERGVEVLLADLAQGSQRAAARVGKHHVQAAFLVLDRRVETVQIGEFGTVRLDGADVLRADLLHGFVQRVLAAASDEDVRAFGNEALRRGQADAAGAAGDQRDFSGELVGRICRGHIHTVDGLKKSGQCRVFGLAHTFGNG